MDPNSLEAITARLLILGAIDEEGAGLALTGEGEETYFIGAHQADKIQTLLRLVHAGARPLAFVSLHRTGRRLEIILDALSDAGPDRLHLVAEEFRSRLVQDGKAAPPVLQ